MIQRRSPLFLLILAVCASPSRSSAREISMIFYLQIRGDESVKNQLLARLESLPCFEEADLHSIGVYETSKEPGGECHAFRRLRRATPGRDQGINLFRIDVKGSIRGRRKLTFSGYVLRGHEKEPEFGGGTLEFREARFVTEAANEIAVRSFMLPPPISRERRFESTPLDDPPR